jgi:hypothetical protein
MGVEVASWTCSRRRFCGALSSGCVENVTRVIQSLDPRPRLKYVKLFLQIFLQMESHALLVYGTI